MTETDKNINKLRNKTKKKRDKLVKSLTKRCGEILATHRISALR